MKCVQRLCLVIVATLVFPCAFASPSMAQSREARELRKREVVLFQARKYAEAIPFAQRELEIDESSLSPDHPYIVQGLNNLAILYLEAERYDDAAAVVKRLLAMPDRPDVLAVLAELGKVYDNKSHYAEAEPLYKRSLAGLEQALGPDHPLVAQGWYFLAMVYHYQGRDAEAGPLLKRALAILEKAYGPGHEVALALNGLAMIYAGQGHHYSEAEHLYQRSLAIYEKAHNNREFAMELNNLAALYVDQGRYAEAEPLYKRALAIWEKTRDPDYAALALMNLGSLYSRADQRRYAEAEPLLKRALAIWENTRGPDNADVASVLMNLAGMYDNQARYAEAEPLYKRALAMTEKALGPDNPDVAGLLNDLAQVYVDQGRYAEAELLYKRALAIWEKALGPDNPKVADSMNNLALLYDDQGRYADALPIVRRLISKKTATIPWRKSAITQAALPALFGSQAGMLIAADDAIDMALNVVQRASQTTAGEALNALAVRFAAGNDRLAELVRKDQDLSGEATSLNKAIIAAVSKEPSKRDAVAEQKSRDRIAAIIGEQDDLGKILQREFPDYAALSRPEPLTVRDIRALLADDDALVVVDVEVKKSYVWAITKSAANWKELPVTTEEISKAVSALRSLLDMHNIIQFDAQKSFELYRKLLAPVEDLLRGKARLNLVLNGALTSLPPQLLVTRDPAGKALKDVDWLIRTHSVTLLPSVASLKVLRGKSATVRAEKPLVGFADPVFDPRGLQQNSRVAADVTAARGIRGKVADVAELRKALPALPETADELKKVAASVHADLAELFLGADATETRVKQEKLDQYRIVYFATHGLLAGDVADFAKLNAEPALVLSLPEKPAEFDDGLLTASEIAQLKLNADWVVLSACNTASGDKPGAEALSGLARAFFYAGARSLVVSNWEVDSDSAVDLMVGTFAALAANPKFSHAEALQKSMLAMIGDRQHPERADPKYWAPFIVVGEPAKPAN